MAVVGAYFMMLDDDIVAVSPTSAYRVLKAAGRLDRRWVTASRKGTGFVQPLRPHQHWHIDVSHINVDGTFFYLTSILDGYSRATVNWDLWETMKEQEIEVIVQKALEKHPGVRPRIISDNGPQFIARDFQQFIRIVGMTHVRTSPYYPQSNGKLERWHGSLKCECIRPACPSSIDEARRRITVYVDRYNTVRLHSAIGYITPADKLQGLEQVIFQERDRKLEEARLRRQIARQQGPPRQRLPDDCSQVTITDGLGGGYGSAEVRPERRPKCQDRSPGGLITARLPRLGDWHQGVKPSRHDAATSRQDVAPFPSSTPP
jgi:putative transposase